MKEKTSVKQKGRIAVNFSVVLLYSFALPFLMGLTYSLLSGQALAVTFASVYRYFTMSGILFAILVTVELYIYFTRRDLTTNLKQLGVILLSVTLCYFLALLFDRVVSIYTLPLILSGLFIAMLVDSRLALFSNILFAIAFFMMYISIVPEVNILDAMGAVITQSVSSSLAIILLRKHYTRITFIINAAVVGLCVSAPIALLCGMLTPELLWSEILYNALWAFLGMIFGVALFLTLLPILETIFGLYSDFKLEEICSPDNKLMRRLQTEARGTYNHSQSVALLAQACAIKIGENPSMARAAAYYHDVGKLKNPFCFTENQSGGYNPHDDFIPEVSVYMIVDHTTYGAELLRKNKLPDEIVDIAKEHHGTTPVGYFLNKAKSVTDEQINREQFCYPGPKPHTKIGGIIMIADTVEAATRGEGVAKDPKQFREFIHKLIDSKTQSGQFSDCPITYKDLKDIEDCLVENVPSLYHQRIKYNLIK